MAELDRMFRSELAVLSDSQNESGSWGLDTTSSFSPLSARHSQIPSYFESASFDNVAYPHLQTDWATFPPNFADAALAHDDHLVHPRPHSSEHFSPQSDVLGLFPSLSRRLGSNTNHTPPDPLNAPFTAHTALPHAQPTVHLSDVTLGTLIPTLHTQPVPTPQPAPPSYSPARSYQEVSEEEFDSSDLELTYPSDSEYHPPALGIDPASLSIPSSHVRPSRRKPRTMTKLPVPIPNLTKKSRGRKVPTSTNGDPIYALSRDKTKKGVRTYTCNADGCGKCFVRGEHLKRHIRSIHTDEKPWVCTYDDCKRAFSRRDNLNQHLRIHKLQDGEVE